MRIAKAIDTPDYEQVLNENWSSIVKQTIDYGIMENAKNILVIPADMDWLDVGTWSSLKSLLPTDEKATPHAATFFCRIYRTRS